MTRSKTWTLLATGGALAVLLTSQAMVATSEAAGKGDPAKGKKVYTNTCAACHGATGAGNGPAGMALNPKPRNFTKEKFKQGSTEAALTRTIENGVPGTPMVAWKSTLKPDDIKNVVAYVRSLIPKANLDKPPAK